jgi:PAS domain-containing protein
MDKLCKNNRSTVEEIRAHMMVMSDYKMSVFAFIEGERFLTKNDLCGKRVGGTRTRLSSRTEPVSEPEVPPAFLDPITNRLIVEPYVAANGVTYDLESIQEYFETVDIMNAHFPFSDQRINGNTQLRQNEALRLAIDDWKKEPSNWQKGSTREVNFELIHRCQTLLDSVIQEDKTEKSNFLQELKRLKSLREGLDKGNKSLEQKIKKLIIDIAHKDTELQHTKSQQQLLGSLKQDIITIDTDLQAERRKKSKLVKTLNDDAELRELQDKIDTKIAEAQVITTEKNRLVPFLTETKIKLQTAKRRNASRNASRERKRRDKEDFNKRKTSLEQRIHQLRDSLGDDQDITVLEQQKSEEIKRKGEIVQQIGELAVKKEDANRKIEEINPMLVDLLGRKKGYEEKLNERTREQKELHTEYFQKKDRYENIVREHQKRQQDTLGKIHENEAAILKRETGLAKLMKKLNIDITEQEQTLLQKVESLMQNMGLVKKSIEEKEKEILDLESVIEEVKLQNGKERATIMSQIASYELTKGGLEGEIINLKHEVQLQDDEGKKEKKKLQAEIDFKQRQIDEMNREISELTEELAGLNTTEKILDDKLNNRGIMPWINNKVSGLSGSTTVYVSLLVICFSLLIYFYGSYIYDYFDKVSNVKMRQEQKLFRKITYTGEFEESSVRDILRVLKSRHKSINALIFFYPDGRTRTRGDVLKAIIFYKNEII